MNLKGLICGIGINDANYAVSKYKKNEEGKRVLTWLCPYYLKWKHMINRCYNQKDLKRRPSYVGSYVCEEWLTFSNFKAWMEKQDWEGKVLDKDIKCKGDPIYSPETCVFITHETNSALTLRKRNKHPLGVSRQKGVKYKALISGGDKATTIFLGYYETQEEAHKKWQLAKVRSLERLALMPYNVYVRDCLLQIAHNVWIDFINNKETLTIIKRNLG